MAYSDKVIDHYNNPRNVGSFTKDTEGVGTGLVGAPECGDVMKLQIKVNLETVSSRMPSSRRSDAGARLLPPALRPNG
jgi:NifU-like protein involved in Fe-S cluster formation